MAFTWPIWLLLFGVACFALAFIIEAVGNAWYDFRNYFRKRPPTVKHSKSKKN